MLRLAEIVERFLRDNVSTVSGVSPPARIGAAVSGGMDSVVLLDVLSELSRSDVTLVVLHYDHGLRADSNMDCAFVEELAGKYRIEFYSERRPELGGARRGSVEDLARKDRYDFFARAASLLSLDAVATAHTADDQAETMLFRLLRGSGARGLTGIPAVRRATVAVKREFLYIRPLLTVRRDEIARHASGKSLNYREDPTNTSLVFARNRIRHQIIPFLVEHANDSLVDTLCRTAEILNRDNAFIDRHVDDEIRKWDVTPLRWARDIKDLQQLDPAILARVLHRILSSFDVSVTYNLIELIEIVMRGISSRGRVDLTRDISARVEGILRKRLVIGKNPVRAAAVTNEFDVACPGETWIAPLELSVTASRHAHVPGMTEHGSAHGRFRRIAPVRSLTALVSASVEFDSKSISGRITVRTRRDGDRMQPLGMKGSKKLQDIFIDEKISVYERDRWPLVCDETGILWVVGLKQDERTRVMDSTAEIVMIDVKRNSEAPDADEVA